MSVDTSNTTIALSQNVPRTRAEGLVDIEVSVIGGRGLGNSHQFRRKPSFSVELTLDNESQRTDVKQSEDDAVLWNVGFMFSATVASSMKIRVYCRHRHSGRDHAVGQASFEALKVERNKGYTNLPPVCPPNTNFAEINIELLQPERSTPSGFLTILIKVSFSVIFSFERDAEMDFRSASYLKQMERVAGSISPDKIKKLPAAWIQLLSSLNTFSSLAQKVAELDSKVKVAVGAMGCAIKVLVDQIKRDEKIDNLGRIMCDLYAYVIDACSVRKIMSFEKTLQRLLTQTAECAYFIADYQRILVFTQRAVVNVISNADTMISNFEAAFGELKIALILGSSLQSTLVSYRILKTAEHIVDKMMISELPILKNVGWKSEKICLRGTRKKTINSVVHWATGTHGDMVSSSRVYVLSGPIASGKSAIAHTVAKAFHEQNRLGAAVFLHDQVPDADLNHSTKISSTFIYQLAGYDISLHARIAAKIKADPSLAWANARRQFRALAVETTQSTDLDNKLGMIGPILIVIDGLDTVSDEEQYQILTTIVEESGNLPPNFRILLTLRDNNIVAQRILGHLNVHIMGFDDTEGGADVSTSQRISQSLVDIFSKNSNVSTQYQLDALQGQLEKRARGIPFWVSTLHLSLLACEDNDAAHLFDHLLSNTLPLSNNEAMDQLYRSLFKVFFLVEISAQHLFNFMIQSSKPMTMSHLRRIAFPSDYAQGGTDADMAQKLDLIVEMDRDEQGIPLFGVHLSLEDFLTNPHRCRGTGLYVDREMPSDQSAAKVSVHVMNQSLRYNICDFEDHDTLMNVEIPDRDSRMERNIPKLLRYACLNWTLHLDGRASIDLDKTLIEELRDFVSIHILQWIEVMSLLDLFNDIEPMLFHFLRWLKGREIKATDYLYELTADAIHFVRIASPVISKAVMQIYISALPLMPSDTLLFQHFSKGAIMGRSAANFDVGHKWNVERVSFGDAECCCSHGSLIALGPRNGGVILMYAGTGDRVQCHITIHDRIRAMAFSPDGKHLTTLSFKGQVAVHNLRTGICVHSYNTVLFDAAITYSHDGTSLLISSKSSNWFKTSDGSYTYDCYVWNTLTGDWRLFKMPHWSAIALSPDGQKLAIPNERGIELVDAYTGQLIDVIATHSRKLDSVDLRQCLITWSPNAAFMAIASAGESMIRIWSFQDRSVATIDIDNTTRTRGSEKRYAMDFSSDSSRIALACSCGDVLPSVFSIQIWDTKTAKQIGQKEIDAGPRPCEIRQLSIFPDCQEIWILYKTYTVDRICVYHLSDASPAYMTNPPTFRDFKPIPTVFFAFSMDNPNYEYASTVDDDGWIVNSEGKRMFMVPYPRFDVVSASHRSSTSTISLAIIHPESKTIVLKYVIEFGQRTRINVTGARHPLNIEGSMADLKIN